MSFTPILDEIDQRSNTETVFEHVLNRTGVKTAYSRGADYLINYSYSPQEVKQSFERFLRMGAMMEQWDMWFNECLTDDVFYLTTDNHLWSGKDEIKRNLLKQMDMVPFIEYNRIAYYEIMGNRVVVCIWNDMKTKEVISFSNISIYYYAGHGKFFMLEDFYDNVSSFKKIMKHMYRDFRDGGDDYWKFIKGVWNYLFR